MIPEAAPVRFREEQEEEEEISREEDKDAWIRAQVMSYLAGGEGVPQIPQRAVPEMLAELLGEEAARLYLDYRYLGLEMPQALVDKMNELGIGDTATPPKAPEPTPEPPRGAALPSGALAALKEVQRLSVERIAPERIAKPILDYMVEVWTAPVANWGIELVLAQRWDLPDLLKNQIIDIGEDSGMEADESLLHFEQMRNSYVEVLYRGRLHPRWKYLGTETEKG